MSDNRFHDNNVSGALSQYGSLHPADGGGFVFIPNEEHGFLNVIHFENPNIDKITNFLKEHLSKYGI